MQVRKQQLELDMRQQTGSKSESTMSRLYIVTCLFNLYEEYITRNAGLEETQAGIKILFLLAFKEIASETSRQERAL